LEQLGDARQTTGDVLGLRGFARDLRDDLARFHGLTFGRNDVRADGQEVASDVVADAGLLGFAAGLVLDGDTRTRTRVARLDDHATRQTGDLVELLFHRHAVDDVGVLVDAVDLGEDRNPVGIR